jgi:hypothetical protein
LPTNSQAASDPEAELATTSQESTLRSLAPADSPKTASPAPSKSFYWSALSSAGRTPPS